MIGVIYDLIGCEDSVFVSNMLPIACEGVLLLFREEPGGRNGQMAAFRMASEGVTDVVSGLDHASVVRDEQILIVKNLSKRCAVLEFSRILCYKFNHEFILGLS